MQKILKIIIIFTVILVVSGQGCFRVGPKKEKLSGPRGVFVSGERGEADTWQAFSAMPKASGVVDLSNVDVFRLFEDPQDPGALYWASRANGLFFSYNDGKEWQKAIAPIDTGFIYSVAVHPKNKCILYVTNGAKIYKTEDCSRSWKEIHREDRATAKINSITISQFDPHHVFIVKESGEILRSQDGGLNWNVIYSLNKGAFADIISSHLEHGLMFVTTKKRGLIRSMDYGNTWVRIGEPFQKYAQSADFRRFSLHPNVSSTLYWISNYGILVSNDTGDTWEPIELITPPGSARIYAFDVSSLNDDEMYYTGTVKNRSSLYRSLDGGKTWATKKLPSNMVPTELRVHPTKEGVIYIGFKNVES